MEEQQNQIEHKGEFYYTTGLVTEQGWWVYQRANSFAYCYFQVVEGEYEIVDLPEGVETYEFDAWFAIHTQLRL